MRAYDLTVTGSLTVSGSTTLTGDITYDDLTATGNIVTTGANKVISGSSTSTGSFGAITIDEVIGNWTNTGNTIANLGTVSAATSITATDLIGTNIDGILGADTARAITGTTIDATTDFTIDGLVLTADTITNDATLTIDGANDMVIDVDGGNLDVKDD